MVMPEGKKNRATPRRQPLKQTTINQAIADTFDEAVKRHVGMRDWDQVEADFLWMGRYLELQEQP